MAGTNHSGSPGASHYPSGRSGQFHPISKLFYVNTRGWRHRQSQRIKNRPHFTNFRSMNRLECRRYGGATSTATPFSLTNFALRSISRITSSRFFPILTSAVLTKFIDRVREAEIHLLHLLDHVAAGRKLCLARTVYLPPP